MVVRQEKGKLKLGSTVELVVNTKKAEKKEKALSSKNEEKQIELPLTLSSDKAINDTFTVAVINSSGKVINEGKYSVGGTMNLKLKGLKNSSNAVYEVRVTNNSTGKTKKYCLINVDFSKDPPVVNTTVDKNAFAGTLNSKTVRNVDGEIF